jgi:hypothetical protein
MVSSVAIIALMLSDFMNPAASLPLQQQTTTSYIESGTGELYASFLSSGSVGSIARGASRVPMAQLDLSASCDSDVRVETIALKHIGLGLASDVSSVYLMDGFRRVSRAQSFDQRSKTVELRIPHLVIPRCSAVRLSVLFDFSVDATVASEHGVSLENSTDVQSTANATTLVKGDDSEVVFTTPDKAGSVAVDFLPINKRFGYGRTETVARIRFTADASQDMLLKSMTLMNLGSARDMNLIDFSLETRSGEKLSFPAQRMDGRYIRLHFSPSYILGRGRTVVFLLKAKINASQSRTIDFTLVEKSDLEAAAYRQRH